HDGRRPLRGPAAGPADQRRMIDGRNQGPQPAARTLSCRARNAWAAAWSAASRGRTFTASTYRQGERNDSPAALGALSTDAAYQILPRRRKRRLLRTLRRIGQRPVDALLAYLSRARRLCTW